MLCGDHGAQGLQGGAQGVLHHHHHLIIIIIIIISIILDMAWPSWQGLRKGWKEALATRRPPITAFYTIMYNYSL